MCVELSISFELRANLASAVMNINQANLPDFLIIGAPKSGTTSLYRYLGSHPEIYMSPIKEPHYFAYPDRRPRWQGPSSKGPHPTIVWTLDGYQRLFARCTLEKVAGEASTGYLYSPQAPQAIKEIIPGARLIVVLRHPADRAYSQFCQERRLGMEPLRDFAAALAPEEERIRLCWSERFYYRANGLYGTHLKRYYSLFPKQQLLILLYEDLVADVSEVLRKICRFLGVDDQFRFDTSEHHNVTRTVARSSQVRRMLGQEHFTKSVFRLICPHRLRDDLFHKLTALNSAPKPPFAPELRRELVAFYRADVLKLQKLIDRDLSMWLTA